MTQNSSLGFKWAIHMGWKQVVGMGRARATFDAYSIFLKLNFHYYYFSSYTLCLNIKHFCRLLQHLSHLFPTESQSKRGIEILYPNPYLILLSKHNQRIFIFILYFSQKMSLNIFTLNLPCEKTSLMFFNIFKIKNNYIYKKKNI